jgi:hypothetical protein
MDAAIQAPETDWKVEEGWGGDHHAVDPAFHRFMAGKRRKLQRLFDLFSGRSHRIGNSNHLELRQLGRKSRVDRSQVAGSRNP